MSAPDETLDEQVRRADPDRWLASRLATDPVRRGELVALYALDLELMRIGASVSQALLGEIRLAWWREQVEALAAPAAPPPPHPLLAALAPALREGRLPAAPLLALIEARRADLHAEPFADEAALAAYAGAGEGSVLRAAAAALGVELAAEGASTAGRAWGYVRLMRSPRGWPWRPPAWADVPEPEVAAHLRHRVLGALAEARALLEPLPVSAAPALAYVALAPALARGRDPGPLARRLALLRVSLTGRL